MVSENALVKPVPVSLVVVLRHEGVGGAQVSVGHAWAAGVVAGGGLEGNHLDAASLDLVPR